METRRRLAGPSIITFLLALSCLSAPQPAVTAPRPTRFKKLHRDMVTRVAEGRTDEAYRSVTEYLSRNPNDPEGLFVLAVVQAHLGESEDAVTAVRKAIRQGLPPERFLAGPRELCRPLEESPGFAEALGAGPAALVHGPVLGDVTDGSVRIWARTRDESALEVRVSTDPAFGGEVHRGHGATRAANDWSAAVLVEGLTEDTEYFYDLQIDGQTVPGDRTRSFRTAPARGRPARFAVAFGGGAGYAPQHERIWSTIDRFAPQALLLLGDNVYIDAPESPATQRYCYYRRQSRPEYRELTGSVPLYAVWDDHDFGDNDCAYGDNPDVPAWKRAVLEVFRQNTVNPAYGGGDSTPGCWFEFSYGDVDFFCLDSRYYRPKTTGRRDLSMLGPAQKAWLLEGLKSSRATFKVIASGVPWAPGARTRAGLDSWDAYSVEREEIFRFIETERVEGVLLLSGDRHRSDAWRIERPDGYDLYEFSSSRLTNMRHHPEVGAALFSYNDKCSFGLLSFDTEAGDPEVRYDVVNIDGEIANSLRVARSTLATPARTLWTVCAGGGPETAGPTLGLDMSRDVGPSGRVGWRLLSVGRRVERARMDRAIETAFLAGFRRDRGHSSVAASAGMGAIAGREGKSAPTVGIPVDLRVTHLLSGPLDVSLIGYAHWNPDESLAGALLGISWSPKAH